MHFLDAWEHATGESLWDRDLFRNWKHYLAHALLPDGQNVFDFGDIWEGPLTRARTGADYERVYPGGTLQSNFNVMYRVAARLQDPEAQAVAERYASFGHTQPRGVLDAALARSASCRPAPMASLPLRPSLRGLGRRLRAHVVGAATRPRSRSRPARPRGIASRALLPQDSRVEARAAATRIPMPAASSSGRAAAI